MKYRRLVAYGCSFTSAEETSEFEILGKYTKYDNVRDFDRMKASLPKQDNLEYKEAVTESFQVTLDQVNWATVRDTLESSNFKNSYVRFLADAAGIPWVNRAQGGGTYEQMIYRILHDFFKGELCKDDLVTVGTTTPQRFFYLYKKEGKLSEMPIVLGVDSEQDQAHLGTRVTQGLFSNENLLYRIYQEYTSYQYIGNLLKKHGIHFKILPILTTPDSEIYQRSNTDIASDSPQTDRSFFDGMLQLGFEKNEYYLDVTSFTIFMKENDPTPTNEREMVISYLGEKKVIRNLTNWKHGWGHPTTAAHKVYAEEVLYPVLIEGKTIPKISYNNITKNFSIKAKLNKLLVTDPFIYD